MLLSAGAGLDLANATPLSPPFAPTLGSIKPETAIVFRLNPSNDSLLVAQVHAVGTQTRLSLLDGQGNLLIQSDGQSDADPDDLIAAHVLAGTDYLELQSLAGAGTYTLNVNLSASSQPIESSAAGTQALTPSTLLVPGDFNGDGKADLATPNGLLSGLGDGTFKGPGPPLPISRVMSTTIAMVSGDFNGDGRTDLAVAGYTIALQGIVQVLLSNGDGTFLSLAPVDLGDFTPVSMVARELNADGRTDLAIAGIGSNVAGVVELLPGNGDGTFGLAITTSLGDLKPTVLVAGSFGADGDAGLAVAGTTQSGMGEAEVLLSDGNRADSFRPAMPDKLGLFSPTSGAAGDFNGNGLDGLALLGSNELNAQLEVLPDNGDGTFGTPSAINPIGMTPTALTVGDFDENGRSDLAIAGTAQVEAYLSEGDGTFRFASTTTLNGFSPALVVTADFNDDGRADLAISGSSSQASGVEILMAHGRGTFGAEQPFNLGAINPIAASAGEFNGDGHADLAVVATAAFAPSRVVVVLGNGDGTFGYGRPINLGNLAPEGLATGDFERDDQVDLAVIGTSPATDHGVLEILAGDGDGTFRVATTLDLGDFGPIAITSGDFNGDDRADLAITEADPTTGPSRIDVLLGQGNGTFTAEPPINLGSISPAGLASGDFTGDGQADLAIAGVDPNSGNALIDVWLGQGNGMFTAAVPLDMGDLTPTSIVAGDFSHDGRADLAVAGHNPAGKGGIIVLISHGDVTFTPETPISLNFETPTVLAAGDFNGDGRADLAVVGVDSSSGSQVAALLGNGDGTFRTAAPIFLGPLEPSIFVTGDFNGDGRVDLAVLGTDPSSESPVVELFTGNGDGTFATPSRIDVGKLVPTNLASGDFTGDGRTELVVAGVGLYGQQNAEVLVPDAHGTLRAEPPIELGDFSSITVVTGDFNGDHRADLAVAGVEPSGQEVIEVLMGRGDGTLAAPVTIDLGNVIAATLVSGDFNGDGRTDLAIAGTGPDEQPSVDVLLSRGDGAFAAMPPIDLDGFNVIAMAAGDFSGKGRTDLAVAGQPASEPGAVVVLQGNGDGTFRPGPPIDLLGLDPTTLLAADFTGDGTSDLLVGGQGSVRQSDIEVLMSQGDGTFRVEVPFAPGAVAAGAMTVADFNADGRDDLALAGQDAPVEVLLGHGDGTFGPQPQIDLGAAAPTAAVSADFNNDGHSDVALVLTNLSGQAEVEVCLGRGDGTFVVGTPTQLPDFNPWEVASGDFNGDGRADLAVLGVDIASQEISVEILLGDGDGTFVARPPMQLGLLNPPPRNPSPSLTLVTGDFNGDGHTDLAVAGPLPNGKYGELLPDGTYVAMLMLGKGNGDFAAPIPIDLNGLSQPMAIAAGKFAGDGRDGLAIAGYLPSGLAAIEVLSGNDDGTFAETTLLSLGDVVQPSDLVAGDFAGSGRTDVAVAGMDQSLGHEVVDVFLNGGGNTYASATPIDLGNPVTAMLLPGDFTGDGHLDLAAVETEGLLTSSKIIEVLSSDGPGAFRPLPIAQLNTTVTLIVAGNFNADGISDLFLAGLSGATIALGTGNGQFGGPNPRVIAATPVVADPGDGTNDVFVVDQSGNILWRRGLTQAGSFGSPVIINSGFPAQDIAFVPTRDGGWLAAVDRNDNAISLFAFSAGQMRRVGSLATGLSPAQIVAGDINGDGSADLVIRNSADGTATVYLGDGNGGFTREPDVPIGPGASDLALVALSATGLLDLIVTNQVAGTIGVLPGNRDGTFGTASWYQAGAGPYAESPNISGSVGISSEEGTAEVVGGTFTAGGAIGLAAIDSGSSSLAVLEGLGGGALANPISFLSTAQASVIRSGDFTGNGITDLAVLGPAGVSIFLNNGAGGFGPPTIENVGPDATGLTIADVTGDGIPDLVVGNRKGDVLVLVGEGRGQFAQYRNIDGQIALAAAGGTFGPPTLALSDKASDLVDIQLGPNATPQTIGDQSQGVLAPGKLTLADLRGNGLLDMIVANSGANDILVYLGEELVQSSGTTLELFAFPQVYAVGTDPVDVTVADLTGHGKHDLVVTNQGSNDLSILLGQVQNGNWTATYGPRLRTGAGPTAALVQDLNGTQDILVTDGQSNDVRLLPGLGSGFFNDANPTIFHTGNDPVQPLVAPFTGNPGEQDLVTIDAGSNTLSFFPNIQGDLAIPGQSFFGQSIPSGGENPVSAVEGNFGGAATDLLVANNADGELALFQGGPNGLALARTFSQSDLPNPTALAVDAAGAVFGATAGVDLAIPVILGLGSAAGAGPIALPAAPEQQISLLQPLSPASLELVATLLSVTVESGTGGDEIAPAAALPNQPALIPDQQTTDVPAEAGTTASVESARAIALSLARFVMGLDEAFAGARLLARRFPLFDTQANSSTRNHALEVLDAALKPWSTFLTSLGGPMPGAIVKLIRAGVSVAQRVDNPPGAIEIDLATASSARSDAQSDAPSLPTFAWRSGIAVVTASIGVWALARAHPHLVSQSLSRPRRPNSPQGRLGHRNRRQRSGTGRSIAVSISEVLSGENDKRRANDME
jgi:hypothetical protein